MTSPKGPYRPGLRDRIAAHFVDFVAHFGSPTFRKSRDLHDRAVAAFRESLAVLTIPARTPAPDQAGT